MDPYVKQQLLRKPRFKFWICKACFTPELGDKQRQLRSEHCRFCGSTRPRGQESFDYKTDEELIAAVQAYENSGLTKEILESGLFCSSCGTPISGKEDFCPACGNEAEPTDQPVIKKKRNGAGEMVEVENDGQRFPTQRAKDTEEPLNLFDNSVEEDPEQPQASRSAFSLLERLPFEPRAIFFGIGFLVIVALILALVLPNQKTKVKIMTVENQPRVEIGYIEVLTGDCWDGIDCPAGMVVVSRETKDYTEPGSVVVSTETSIESDPGEEVVDTIKATVESTSVSYGDGGDPYPCSENDEEIDDVFYPGECTPEPEATVEYDYEDVEIPVYGTKTPYPHYNDVHGTKTPVPKDRISYTLDVARTRWHEFAWATGSEVIYPEISLDSSKRETFTGNKDANYRLTYEHKGESVTVSISKEKWLYYMDFQGQEIEADANIFGGLLWQP